jgi:hypothetical protein
VLTAAAALAALSPSVALALVGDNVHITVVRSVSTPEALNQLYPQAARRSLGKRQYIKLVEFSLNATGGLDSGENALATVERYDPALNR